MWIMPMVKVGDSVLWYDAAIKNEEGAYAGTVSNVADQSIDLKLHRNSQTDEWRTDVRHIDDPRLKQNHHFREQGGWEFSDMSKRIYRLEAMFDEFLTKPPSRKKKTDEKDED